VGVSRLYGNGSIQMLQCDYGGSEAQDRHLSGEALRLPCNDFNG
jgi:hypothetical protein